MRSQSIRLALVAGATLAAAGIAQAGGPTVDVSKLTAGQQAHMAKSQEQQLVVTPLFNYDVKPPVLKSVNVGGKIHANEKYAQIVVSLAVGDNLSGVDQVMVTLMGPSGQTAGAGWDSPYESARNELQIGVDMSDVSENGVWRIYNVSVVDANNNVANFDEAALAALGKTTFTVVGATGDTTWPAAGPGGVNLTPTVSRSTPPRGMLPGSLARTAVKLKISDTGGSGIRGASMAYCLQDAWWDCIYLDGQVPVRGKSSTMLTLGGKVNSYVTPGTYVPYSLGIYDYAGNSNTYYESDINAFIDSPAITITE